MSGEVRFLWQYPFVIVRVECNLCGRRGSYRLARLAERLGADSTIEDMLDHLAGSRCRYARPWKVARPRKYVPLCHIMLPDLRGGGPPDLQPGEGVRLVVNNDAAE